MSKLNRSVTRVPVLAGIIELARIQQEIFLLTGKDEEVYDFEFGPDGELLEPTKQDLEEIERLAIV